MQATYWHANFACENTEDMKTQWEYIALYKEEVAALIQQQLAELQNTIPTAQQPINEKLKSRLVLYTTHLSEAYLSQPVAARA